MSLSCPTSASRARRALYKSVPAPRVPVRRVVISSVVFSRSVVCAAASFARTFCTANGVIVGSLSRRLASVTYVPPMVSLGKTLKAEACNITCYSFVTHVFYTPICRSVILFDQGFDVSTGIYQTGMRKGLQVLTNNRHIILKCWTRRKCKEWMQYLKQTANSYARDFTYPNPHMSYAPVRSGIQASWHVDGSTYMGAIADALEEAKEEIYIADWWLSPEIYMKRPAVDGDYWRLDKILHRKAVRKFT